MATQFRSLQPTARLSDRVADALATEIPAGRFAAGEKLPTESSLSAQFGVSRTVVREAVSRLRSLGMVDPRQGSGVYVLPAGLAPLAFDVDRSVSQQAVIQMVEVRRALEAEAAELAAERRDRNDVRQIREALDAVDAAVAAGRNGVAEDVEFHRRIAKAARNPFLLDTLRYLSESLQRATRVTRANEARLEHQRILRAIEAGDPAAARRAGARHMDNAIIRIGHADPAFWDQEGEVLAKALVGGLHA